MQIVAHRPTQSSVILWIQAEVTEIQWAVRFYGSDGEVREWNPESAQPHLLPNTIGAIPDTRVWMPKFDGLSSDTNYSVYFVKSTEETLAATFSTLPLDLERPFTVLLASCYSEDDDLEKRPGSRLLTRQGAGGLVRSVQHAMRRVRRSFVTAQGLARSGPPAAAPRGPVSRRYREFVEAKGQPDIKILTGDQVYVDAPIWHFLLPRGQGWIKRHLSGTYFRTWNKLNWFLSRGGNYFTSDDHEFWNNFPTTPVAWPAFWFDAFQATWELHAREFLRWVQDPQPSSSFDLGEPAVELSFLLLDTRMNRGRAASGDGFMGSEELRVLLNWVANLQAPGVLVLGQPLLANPGNAATDYNLSSYSSQYQETCAALRTAPHDVLILSGDIHYGRIARIAFPSSSPEVPARQIVEIVSSPLAALLGKPGYFSSSTSAPQWFPPEGTFPANKGLESARVQYTPIAPAAQDGRCANHFVDIVFSRCADERGSVMATVTTHVIGGEEGSPPPPSTIMLA